VTFVPLTPVAPGELLPCGSNPDGSIREFFANPADVDELLRDGIRMRELGTMRFFRCRLTATPYYANGDVQIQVVPVS
jgi:hypothetical protein